MSNNLKEKMAYCDFSDQVDLIIKLLNSGLISSSEAKELLNGE